MQGVHMCMYVCMFIISGVVYIYATQSYARFLLQQQ